MPMTEEQAVKRHGDGQGEKPGAAWLAIDIGAGSGRVICGRLADGIFSIEEIYRFENKMTFEGGHHRWDVERLFSEIVRGLRECADRGIRPESIGIDTWGVDYALLDGGGTLIEAPFAYRDQRTGGMMEELFKIIPKESLYSKTGIQFMEFNTIFQLFAERRSGRGVLERAKTILLMPDYLNYRLTGFKGIEYTNATTTQLVDAAARNWSRELITAIGVDPAIFPAIVKPGAALGTLRPEIRSATGLPPVKVVAPATHDTGSAVAAAPLDSGDHAYISSGTWSLAGIESPWPIISPESFRFNLTNEGGVEGSFRVLRNIMGLWIVRRLREELAPDTSYAEISAGAADTPSPGIAIEVNHASFLNPASMKTAIIDYCREHGLREPSSSREFFRVAYEGLANAYAETVRQLGEARGRPITGIHVIGGGAQDETLCRMTAERAGITVSAGPVEATAIGNIAIQAIAAGQIKNLSEARRIIGKSFEIKTYRGE